MKHLAALIVFGAVAVSPAHADFQDGLDAYDRGDYELALKELLPLAEKGNPEAQVRVGYLYALGNGISQNYDEAANWYRLAAEQGQATAQNLLGLMYESGQGVPQDQFEAVKWYRRAAEQGDFAAQYNLGVMYAEGRGAQQDYVLAHMWLNLSAGLAGNEFSKLIARQWRDSIAGRMTPSQIEEAQRLAREWMEEHR